MLGYAAQRYLSIAVAVVLAGIGVVQAANPADFGLTPVAVRWLGVATAMLGVLATVLPSVRGLSRDPEFLAKRVSELDPHDRQHVARGIAERTGDLPPQPDYSVFIKDVTDELWRRREREAGR